MAQSVSQDHECLSVVSSHGVADTLCSVLMFGLATAHHHLIVIIISEYQQQNGLWLQQAVCPAGGGGECGHHR